LLIVAPLQQPLALLQYANRSREIGLLRLGLVIFGPVGCVLGQGLAGPPGVAAGLGVAEILAYALVAPRFAVMPSISGFFPYFGKTLSIGVATAALSGGAAWALHVFVRPYTLAMFLAEVVVWGCLIVLPLLYIALPGPLKRAALARLAPTWRGASR
jgi:hypothetical protein